MTLYLQESDVAALLDMPTVVEIMGDLFGHLAAGEGDNVPRKRARGAGIVLHSMSAAAPWLGLVGWKQYTTTRTGAQFLVGLYDQETGDLLALMQANHLGQMRTGAVTGLAARHLASGSADQVGLIGSGYQAETQLAAVAASCPIRHARVFSRSESRRQAFADRMRQTLGISVEAVASAAEAVREAAIVITATSSREPVFDGSWLSPGTLVAAIGSNWLQTAEIDVATVRRAQLIVCDSVACCREEAGDFTEPIQQGIFRWEDAVELSQIVAGDSPQREGDDSLTIFKSVGMAIEDVAVGHYLLQAAREQGVGQELPL